MEILGYSRIKLKGCVYEYTVNINPFCNVLSVCLRGKYKYMHAYGVLQYRLDVFIACACQYFTKCFIIFCVSLRSIISNLVEHLSFCGPTKRIPTSNEFDNRAVPFRIMDYTFLKSQLPQKI